MGAFILGLIGLILLVILARVFTQANPAALAVNLRKGLGVALLLGAVALALFGRIALAGPLALVGFSILGFGGRNPFAGMGSRSHRSPGQTSTVRSPWLEMTLDHDSGNMEGTILRGQHAGDALDALLPHLRHLPLVALAFPAFNDGRSYSKAELLRTRHGYRGEIRATGDVPIDQVAQMGLSLIHS